jgi:hypothetical protein
LLQLELLRSSDSDLSLNLRALSGLAQNQRAPTMVFSRRVTRLRYSWPVLMLALVGSVGCGRSERGQTAEPDGGTHPGELLLLDDDGLPWPNLQVQIAGTMLTTDEAGLAPLPDLPPTYDVITGWSSRVFAYIGLTSRSPTLALPDTSSADPEFGVLLEVERSPDLAADQDIVVTLGLTGPKRRGPWSANVVNDQGIATDAYWDGDEVATLSAEAFLVDRDPDTHQILRYSGYAEKEWKNPNNEQLQWSPDFVPPPFDTATIHFDVAVPSGAGLGEEDVNIVEASGRSGAFSYDATDPNTELLVPNLPGVHYDLQGAVGDFPSTFVVQAENVRPGAEVHLQALVGPQGVAPSNLATDVGLDTEFSWTEVEGAVYSVGVYGNDVGDPEYHVFTSTPSAHLPDASAFSTYWPRGKEYYWLVHSENGHRSLDAFAAGEPPTAGFGDSDPMTFTSRAAP